MTTRTCPECGKDFEPSYRNQVVCGERCKKLRDRRRAREAMAIRREIERQIDRVQSMARVERREMKRRLKERDARCPQPKIEIVERDGVVTERRGHVPIGGCWRPF